MLLSSELLDLVKKKMINDHLTDFFYKLIYILLHELNQWMSGDLLNILQSGGFSC